MVPKFVDFLKKATKETFVDGWVRTGDEVMVNENMEIFIINRLKEMLKVHGFQVAPAEMEAHLTEHPFVSKVCVVGIPHEFHRELPFAFIVPEKKTAALIAKYPEEEAKLRDIIAKHVTDHKVPYKALFGGIEFVDSVPNADSGSSSETPPHPHEQWIFVQAPLPPGVPSVVQPGFVQPGILQPGILQPGILQPGMLQPGVVQPGDVIVHPGMPQPGGYIPGQTAYPPHPGPTYVPVTSTH